MTEADDIISSEIYETVYIPEAFGIASCDAVKAMLEKIYKPAPSFLKRDGFWNESNYLLIDLTEELTKGHLSIKQAEILYRVSILGLKRVFYASANYPVKEIGTKPNP